MEWSVKYTDAFGDWWDHLTAEEQEDVNAVVILLQRFGPALRFPYIVRVSPRRGTLTCASSGCSNAGRPYRILYAFDLRRTAILLIGGDKTGDDRWDEIYVPLADRLYDEHLAELRQEGERTDGEARERPASEDVPRVTGAQ
jgi:hypothetical protein